MDRAELLAVADLPGIEHIHPHDLRFGWRRASFKGNFRALVNVALRRKSGITPGVIDIAQRIREAAAHTYPQEVITVALALAHATGANGESAMRRATALAARYGVGVADASKVSVEGTLGVTWQRIQQLTEPLLACAREASPASPALAAFLERISRHAGLLAIEQVQAQEEAWLQGCKVRDALRFAEQVLGARVPVLEVARESGQSFAQTMSAVADAAASLARRTVENCGACNLATLTGALFMDGHDPDRVRRAIETLPGREWLGEQGQWFTLKGIDSGPFHRRLRKVLAVADQPLTASELCEVMVADWREPSLAGEHYALAPAAIVDAALRHLGGLQRNERGGWSGVGLLPREHLASLELAIFESLLARGGVARTGDIIADCVNAGWEATSTRVSVGLAPFVQPLMFGVIRLRGRRIDPAVMRAVLLSARPNSPKNAGSPTG